VLRYLRIPSALPYFLGGLRIAGGLSLIGAVVAEFTAGTAGKGSGLALPDPRIGIPAQYPADVRGAVADHDHGRRHLPALHRVVALMLHKWHESAMKRET
jgi:NitT/TauT family transport system permease protein